MYKSDICEKYQKHNVESKKEIPRIYTEYDTKISKMILYTI